MQEPRGQAGAVRDAVAGLGLEHGGAGHDGIVEYDGSRRDGAGHDGAGPGRTEPVRAWSIAERLARTLRVPATGPRELVTTVTSEAVSLVEAAHSCGVIVTGQRGDMEIVATTDAVPRTLDELQQDLGSGPCLTAARKQIVVRLHDVPADTRWPRFREVASELGVATMLCLPLYVDDDVLGTLSLYGTEPGAFREGAEPVARLLAALTAIALAESRLAEQMRVAMANRDLIGQAKGILMREHRITAEEAFTLLRLRSQHTNTKLVDVARRVSETGTLDG
ncbi:GAF and ANTAR domain-containing protein [Pseudonocardia humida]|uniref:GAF and ANTAR domain-containing protein n=1 Tax=Pseudonocardia humida TaxID=2800819 RepID=A0ABT1A6I8_9PSEU|nr:GAF and ANTAR domain-containing protein [Pseudonocardia humida]MCO1658637.1 GAF and ANTAR domain-containing protein [Pseudonocardia humida]